MHGWAHLPGPGSARETRYVGTTEGASNGHTRYFSRIAKRLRCRVGFHKWVHLHESDPDLDNPSEDVRVRTVCRYCRREYGAGLWFPVTVAGAATVGGVMLLLLGPPLLGAILVMGGVMGLMVSMVPASVERLASWLGR